MSSTKDGTMIILSSPSGTGKTTLVKLLAETKNYQISISHTTRKSRHNEVSGKDYFFTNKQHFKDLINTGEFLEHAKVFNNFYGTTLKPVKENLDKGKNVIFDIDWQGTEQILKRNLDYKLITIFILPPSKNVLYERLANRHKKDKSIVSQRIKQFDKDILHWKNYDYVVINDQLKICYDKIIKILEAELENKKSNYDMAYIEDHIKKLI